MAKYIILFIGFFATISIQAQNTAKIVFEENVFDFGELPEGPKVETEFVFKNIGDAPLIISNAKGSCGCTVPQWPKEPVLPGDSGVIKVVYNTARRVGAFTKNVTLTTNAETPTSVLKIRGTVVKEPEEETMPIKESIFTFPNN